ncbi:hypothetical protein [Microcoleus sp. PH2017_05_CCC_O_A]|uniref:hypothetical protein n=1 Tax=Microcoleus sp. PH2017_05_CCC_O_A TaxID=2798816 RepID=UPI001DDF1A48|nr:hypothetical protein [Microcoleus sp. PH2017_05_CCC_O_A]MCC3439373.1 hypothetical protein [Microcoleus sp. PH2017_05_CCC_O_A]
MLNCCNNLNRSQSGSSGGLTEDVTTTATIGTSSTAILSANASRKLVKLYLTSLSNPAGECWIRYGAGATLANSAHPLPLRHLLIIDEQAANAISAICSPGTAQLRVSVANAL